MIKIFFVAAFLLFSLGKAEEFETAQETESTESPIIKILKFQNEQYNDGSYNFGYESEDGSKRTEQAYYKDSDKTEEGKIQVVEGSYSYVNPSGELITVHYIADENGFRPRGNIIHPSISSYLETLQLEAKQEEPSRRV